MNNISRSESSVLTNIFLHPEKLTEIKNNLQPEEFGSARYKSMYELMLDTHSTFETVDTALLLHKAGEDESLQDLIKNELMVEDVVIGNIESHIKIIKEDHHRRQTKRTLEKAFEDLRDLEDLKTILSRISDSVATQQLQLEKAEEKTTYTATELVTSFLEDIDKGELNNGVDPHIPGLNIKYEKGDLIVIAGRPAMGKTAFALQVALNISSSGERVGLYSLEMTPNQIMARLLQNKAALKRDQIIGLEKMSPKEEERLGHAVTKIASLKDKLQIVDIPGCTVVELASKIRAEHKINPYDTIVIDYLQLIQGAKDNGTEYGDVTEISKTIKLLARELNIPIIGLAQLSRAVETRASKKPILSDLRSSGQIEQDAAVVHLLYRDEYYNEDSEFKGIMEVITAKGRHTGTGTTQVRYFMDTQKITEYQPIYKPAQRERNII